MDAEKRETQQTVKKEARILASFQQQLLDRAFEARDFGEIDRLPGFQIAQDIMLAVLRPVNGIIFVPFDFLEDELDRAVRRAKSLSSLAKGRRAFIVTGSFHFRPRKNWRSLRGRILFRLRVELLHSAALRLDARIFDF